MLFHSFHGHIILYSFPFEVAPPEFWYHFHIFLHLPCLRNILLQVMNGGGRKNSWKITGKKTGFHLCIVCIYRVYVLDSVSHSRRGNGEWFGVGLLRRKLVPTNWNMKLISWISIDPLRIPTIWCAQHSSSIPTATTLHAIDTIWFKEKVHKEFKLLFTEC